MTQLATGVWTYEKYLALPEDGNRYEIIRGELFVTPPPTNYHQFASSEIFYAIKRFVDEHQLGYVYHPPFEVHLSDETRPVQPDIIFIRKENKPKGRFHYFEGVPDLVVEILSKSTARADLGIKFLAYEEAGIPEYWIADPKTRSIRIYVLAQGQYAIHGEYVHEEVITSKVLEGFTAINSTLFDPDID